MATYGHLGMFPRAGVNRLYDGLVWCVDVAQSRAFRTVPQTPDKMMATRPSVLIMGNDRYEVRRWGRDLKTESQNEELVSK